MTTRERINEAYIKWIEKYYGYMLFEIILKLKWENLALEQGGLL